MRLTSRSGKHSGALELNMTPMIDCVFLLLIFFMVTASFTKTERELNPNITVQRPSAKATSDLQPTIVEVVRGGSGAVVYRVGGRELATLGELTNLLRQMDNKSLAYVRVADDATFDLAAGANQAAKDAGFASVVYVAPSDGK